MKDLIGRTLGYYRIVERIGLGELRYHRAGDPLPRKSRFQALLGKYDTEG